MFTHRSKLAEPDFVQQQLLKFIETDADFDLKVLEDYLSDLRDERSVIVNWLFNDHQKLMEQVYNFRRWRTNANKNNIHHSGRWQQLKEFCGTSEIYIGIPTNCTYGNTYFKLYPQPRIPINIHKNNLNSVGIYTLIARSRWSVELAVWFPEIKQDEVVMAYNDKLREEMLNLGEPGIINV